MKLIQYDQKQFLLLIEQSCSILLIYIDSIIDLFWLLVNDYKLQSLMGKIVDLIFVGLEITSRVVILITVLIVVWV